MAKNISTILNLKDNWTSVIKKMQESTSGFRKIINDATSSTKIFADKGAGSLKNFERQITHTSNSMNKFGSSAKNVFSSTAGKIALFTGGLGLAAAAKQSIELASDLVEVQNVVDETFGTGAKQINAWSKTALNSFGLSTLQAKQFTGYLGAMMKSSGITGNSLIKMSENLSGLAGDIASFDNLPIEDAFEKIRSGISGETEPLKQLGINMDVTNLSHYALAKGIKTSWNEMSQAQQTMLRYQYLMSVTKDKQGDFTRTQNTFANQVRLAKVNLQQLGASIGTYALPPLNKILNAFNNGGMKSIGTVVGGAFASIANVAKSLSKPMQDLWKSLSNFSKAAGITSLFKNLFSGVNTETLQKVKDLLAGLLKETKSFVDYCTAHIGTIKILFAGLGGAIAGVKIANEFIKIRDTINGVKKAGEGLSGFSKFSNMFAKMFGKSPQFALFTIAIAGIGVLAYVIIKNWSTVKTFFDKFFKQMHGGFILTSVGILSSIQIIRKLGITFTDLRIAGLYAGDAIKKIGSGIGGGFSKAGQMAKTLGSNLLNVGRNALTAARNIGTFIARSAMTGISKGASLVRTLGSNILSVGRNALTASRNVAVMAANVAKQGIIFAANAIKIALFKTATLAVAAAQRTAAVAQRILNIAMNANPIIKIVTIIFSLVGALVVLYNKNVWFREKVNAIFAWFKELPANFKKWAHDMIDGFVRGIKEKIEDVKKGAKNIAEAIKKILHFSTPDEGPLRPYESWMPDFINGMTQGMITTTPNILKSTTNMTTGMANKVKSYVNTCRPTGISVVSELAAGIGNSGAQSNILSVVKNLTTKITTAFKEGFGIHSPSRVFFKIGSYIVQGFVNGLTSKDMGGFIKNWIGNMTGAVSGNVTSWLTAAMAITGTPMSFLPILQNIAMHESGGNPNSINLWDSNAKAGHPSKGLMQMIDETFNRWALPGMNDIWNPIHNAVSSIRYMIGRYGSIQNVPGIRSQLAGGGYVGYLNGTNSARRGMAALSEDDKPELVIGKQFRYFKGGEQVINNRKLKSLFSKNGDNKITVNLNIQGNMIGNEQYAEEMGDIIGDKLVSILDNM